MSSRVPTRLSGPPSLSRVPLASRPSMLSTVGNGFAAVGRTGGAILSYPYEGLKNQAIVPVYTAISDQTKLWFAELQEWNKKVQDSHAIEYVFENARKQSNASQIDKLKAIYYNHYPVIYTGRGQTIRSTAEPVLMTNSVERALLTIRKDMSLDERFRLIKTAIEKSQNHKDYQSIITMLMKYPDVVNHTMETVLDGRLTQETLLMTAAKHNKTRVIYKLLSMGANANLKNAEDKTAIMLLNPEGEDFIKALRCMISYADAFGKAKLDLGELPLKYLHAWRMHPKHQVVLEDDWKILEKTLEQAQKTRREHQKTLSAPAIKPSPHRTLPLFEPAPPYSALPPPGSVPPAYSRLPIS